MPLWVGEAGGELAEKKRVGELQRQYLSINRAPPRVMTTEELCQTIYRFLAPPWISVGVSTSKDLLQARKRLGFDEAGALWIASGSKRVFPGIAIPLGLIPYENINTGKYDDGQRRFVSGTITRGWRGILAQLRNKGYLRRRDPELLWLIGSHRDA